MRQQPPQCIDEMRAHVQQCLSRPWPREQQRARDEIDRHDHEADERHRHQVRGRRDQRGLPEEPHRQGQQRQRHQQGRGSDFLEMSAPAGLVCQRPRQQSHARERQPEPRRQHGKRIDHQDRRQRQPESFAEPTAAAQQPPARDDGNHQQGARGRQAETGQRTVRERSRKHDHGFGQGPRQPQPERWKQPPDEPDQQGPEHRSQTYVESRNRDQVRDAGRTHHLPVALVQRAFVTDGKRPQQARGMRVARQRRPDRIGNARPHTIDAGVLGEHRIGRIFAHVAGGDDALLQSRTFEIHPAWIHQAMRPLHPHPQPPGRARHNRGRRVLARGVPRQSHVAAHRNGIAVELRRRDHEVETRRIFLRVRQIRHRAGDQNVLFFERVRQACVHREIRTPCRPCECRHGDGQTPNDRRRTPAQACSEAGQRSARKQSVQPAWRQCRQHLHRDGTAQDRDRDGQHPRPGSDSAASPARVHVDFSRIVASAAARRRSIPARDPFAARGPCRA